MYCKKDAKIINYRKETDIVNQLGYKAGKIEWLFGKKCSACKEKVRFFRNYGVKSDFFKKNNIIGGGRRKHVLCPVCGANDRIRWVDYVITRYTNIYTASNCILHIAPEKVIENKIRKNSECNYITGDIEKGKADYVVDITNMNFSDNKFDFIIVNHVMEHVVAEGDAFKEIYRCLKKTGVLIISFPICLDRVTSECKNSLTKKEALELYGQEDHCRLYGYDVKQRIENFGFAVTEYNVSDLMNKHEIKEKVLLKNDRIYLCRKNIS